jgi:hypothetical protein
VVDRVDGMTITDIRPGAPPKLADFATRGYEPPTRDYRFAHLRVLALDQALRFTGLVEVTFEGPRFEVIGHHTLTSDYELAGNTAVLQAGVVYFGAMREVLMNRVVLGTAQVVVYELPPNPNRMYRPESAMMAALCVNILCTQLNLEHHMVQAQAAKTLWAANPRANKTQLKRGILEKFPWLKQEMARATEHEWDALALALTYALGEAPLDG